MSLDIHAMSKAVSCAKDENDRHVRYIYTTRQNPDLNRLDGKPEGYYRGRTDFAFRVGSYGNYNEWRDWLSKTFIGVMPDDVWKSPVTYHDKPFYEIVNFFDNETSMGPKTSAKLAADFRAHLPTVQSQHTEGAFERDIYEKFLMAFELASDDGFVTWC